MTTTRRLARRRRGTAACRWCCRGRRRSTCRMSARTTTTRCRSARSRCRPNNDPMDLNAPDIGTAYLPQYQDPTAPASTIPGARALPTDLMRPYRGLGAIIATRPIFYTQYDSLQTSFNRRFRNGWQGGLNWTLSLRHQGQHGIAEAPAAQRRRHDRSPARTGRGRRGALERRAAAASHQGQFRVGSAGRCGERRGLESARRDRQRLAGVRRVHRRQRRAV